MAESRLPSLSDRQRDCLRLVGRGHTTKEIAIEMGLSPATVDSHIRAALLKLGLRNRDEAARQVAAADDEAPSRSTSRRSANVARTIDAGPVAAPVTAAIEGNAASLLRLPPIGGRPNDLRPGQRLFAIARIAFVAVLVFVVCVMVISGAYRVLS